MPMAKLARMLAACATPSQRSVAIAAPVSAPPAALPLT